jgi:excisionase family DNA binding protein
MSKLLTIDQLAEELQVSKHTIYKWVAASKIPHIPMPNRKVRFDMSAIEKWLKSRTVTVNEYA